MNQAYQSQQPREQDPSPEDSGLDPQMHQAVLKVAKSIAGREIARERAVFEQQIGILANRTEKAELLASKGSSIAKYIPEIQAKQQEHARATGSFLPADIALMMIQDKEKDERIRYLEAKAAGGNPPPPVAQAPAASPQAGGVPNAAGTRVMHSAPPSTASLLSSSQGKKFSEMSVPEMEAQLEEQFKQGAVL